LPSQPASLFPFAASSSSSNSSAGGAVAPYLLMGASSLGSHAAHDSHSSFAVSSSATRTRRRKKSISSSSAHTHSGAFPFMFDGLDDNDVGSSGALASLPATYPFAAASVSAPSLHSGDARAVGFATHTVYLRKKEGVRSRIAIINLRLTFIIYGYILGYWVEVKKCRGQSCDSRVL
jgi:hypothetical protein